MLSMNWQNRIVKFVREIGLSIESKSLEIETFLPGIAIDNGGLKIDSARLLSPGDILHEAGHLAVLRPPERAKMSGNAGADGGEEMAAIAWSYAAAQKIGLPLEILFHDKGYKGQADWLCEHFRESNHGRIGVPLLSYFGMTNMPSRNNETAATATATAFPEMTHWLRQE